MGDMITAADAVNFMQDETFLDEVISHIVDDPEVMDELASDMAGEIASLLEDDPSFKKKLLVAAMGSVEFKKRITKSLVEEMGD